MAERPVDDRQIAIHEAGHAVAHYRLGIFQATVSIESEEQRDVEGNLVAETLGRAVGEGWEHVSGPVQAADQVLAYYSGFMALVADGYSVRQASLGADDDFALASHLIEVWDIGDEAEWRHKAELLMRDEANVAAVARVAEELLLERQLQLNQLQMLIDVADGEITEEEYQRYKLTYWSS